MGIQNPKELYISAKAAWSNGKRFTALWQVGSWILVALIALGTAWEALSFLGVPSPQELFFRHVALTTPIVNNNSNSIVANTAPVTQTPVTMTRNTQYTNNSNSSNDQSGEAIANAPCAVANTGENSGTITTTCNNLVASYTWSNSGTWIPTKVMDLPIKGASKWPPAELQAYEAQTNAERAVVINFIANQGVPPVESCLNITSDVPVLGVAIPIAFSYEKLNPIATTTLTYLTCVQGLGQTPTFDVYFVSTPRSINATLSAAPTK